MNMSINLEKKSKSKAQTDYEEVTIEVPKAIMNLLRDSEKVLEMTAKEYIEYNIVALVRSEIGAKVFAPNEKQLADQYKLNPIFKELLNKLPENKCLRCGHNWTPRTEDPRQCPKCKSPYWNKPKKKE